MNQHTHLKVALCQAAPDADLLVAALNFSLPADGSVPEWVELIPAGEKITGRDGRSWNKPSAEAIVSNSIKMASATNGLLPFDWEHATEPQAPKGNPAPASGWIVELQARNDGSIWGRVDWTATGRNSIANKEYRFISPVFTYSKATNAIACITSAALTNTPNLLLTALNRVGPPIPGSPQETETMLPEFIRKALGLPEGATEADAQAALNSLKGQLETARNQANMPSLDKFVPRGDYDLALNRATTAEQKLADAAAAQLNDEIETAVTAALTAGKITPATADFYKANCRREGGLEDFKKFVATAPVVAADSGLSGKQHPDGQATAMNSDAKLIANLFGNSVEDLNKHREQN